MIGGQDKSYGWGSFNKVEVTGEGDGRSKKWEIQIHRPKIT